MKKLIILSLAAMLAACGPRDSIPMEQRRVPPVEITAYYELPKEMQECKVYKLETKSPYPDLYVVNCPNATTDTTYKLGKQYQRLRVE